MWDDLTEAQRKAVLALESVDNDFFDKMCGSGSGDTVISNGHVEEKFLKEFHRTSNEDSSHGIDKMEHNALVAYNKEAKMLLDQLNSSRDMLISLLQKYETVAKRTSSLHEACDQLMADQTKLASVAEEIRHRLTYFDHVEQISTKLQSPLLSVTGESFMHMLATIDEAMTFLSQQKEYKEASVYLNKCQQCLAKALSRIKSHIVNLLTAATASVQTKVGGDKNKNEDTFTLFYGLYATHAPPIKSLMDNLEQRWDKNAEYQFMLNECYSHYFSQRDILLQPSVRASITQLAKTHSTSGCYLVRSGCSFLIRLCEDEYHLFTQFFTRSSDLLHDFLERLCRVFYDIIRPIVIHVPHLETLAELCTIMKVEMLEERCALDPDIYAGFVRVISELVGDAGERLIYRAQMYARTDILGYKPAPGDLAYPQKLIMMEAITKSTAAASADTGGSTSTDNEPKDNLKRQSSINSIVSATSQEVAFLTSNQPTVSAADLHGLWYPTVRRTIMCLSKLFKCLDGGVFQGVSEDILSLSVQSLNFAADKISAEKGFLNGQLFLVKHLLILREQTTPFRGTCSVKEASMDFSRIKDNAMHLFQQKSKWFSFTSSNVLLEFLLQVPANVSEHMIDSRRTLDLQLRDACQKLISNCSNELTKEMNDFIQKAEVIASMGKSAGGNPVSLSQQPFAAAQVVHEIVNTLYNKLRTNVPNWRSLLSTYIGSKDTENILFAPIRRNVETSFTKFRKILQSNYNDEELQVISCPSGEEIGLLLV